MKLLSDVQARALYDALLVVHEVGGVEFRALVRKSADRAVVFECSTVLRAGAQVLIYETFFLENTLRPAKYRVGDPVEHYKNVREFCKEYQLGTHHE